MGYYQHKIYCDLDYKTLLSMAADHFESLKYYQPNGKLFKNNRKIYQDSGSISFSAAAARSLFETSEDVFIISDNLKGKFSRKEIDFKILPIRVQQRFKNMPNILKVDLSTRLYKYQYKLVADISNKLKNAGYIVYDDCFNGQLLGLFDSHYEDDIKIELIHSIVKEYFSENDLPELNLTLFSNEFSLLIGNLEKDSLLVLKTAEYLREIVLELPDYSPIVIEYCKIIEIEIYYKILLPLKNRLNGTTIVTANSLKKLKTFITSTENKSIELGTFSSILESIINNNLNDNLAINLIDSISHLPFQRNAKYLVQDIFHLTRNYRNKAAHKSILTKEDMESCREFIIGNQNHTGLLSKIVKIG